MKKILSVLLACLCMSIAFAQADTAIRRKDRKKDILIRTSMGDMRVRLSDSTPLHRDNFIKLVKQQYFDSVLFHRVIKNFMIQAGDPNSKRALPGQALGSGGPGYRVPAEFRQTLFHKKGVIAAARDNNPEKASSGSQFYIVQGKVFTDAELDSVEIKRLEGRKLSLEHRAVYKTIGGTPQLDKNYTVFGELIAGIEVLEAIAATTTSKGPDRDRPLTDIRIISMKLVKRKKHK